MSDKIRALSDGFSRILSTAKDSFGGEVDLLDFKLDTGDAVVSELRWLERLTQEKLFNNMVEICNAGFGWRLCYGDQRCVEFSRRRLDG